MTSQELIEKLDSTIRDFERAALSVEKAQGNLNEISQKLGQLVGVSTNDIRVIKDEAHRKIGQLLLAERRQN